MLGSLNPHYSMSPGFRPPTRSSFITTKQNQATATVQAFAGATANEKPKNLYQVLRVQQNASAAEIKSAYRNLVKHFHPDVAKSENSNTSKFIEIQNAYQTLYDSISRERYNHSIQARESVIRYQDKTVSSDLDNSYGSGFRTRRWETDQCW